MGLKEILIGVVSVIIGALLSGIGYLVKTRYEHKKLLNEALFNLLEIWYVIRISTFFDVSDYMETYLRRVKDRFPEANFTKEDEEQYRQNFPKVVITSLQNFTGPAKEKLHERYLGSIRKLSGIAPILAFELSGNQNLDLYLEHFDKLLNEFSPLPSDAKSESESASAMEYFRTHVKKLILSDTVHDLENDLRRLARKCGTKVWYQTVRKIHRIRKREKDLPIKFADEAIDKVISPLIKKTEEIIPSSFFQND